MRRLLAVLVLASVISSACGARWSKEQRVAVTARHNATPIAAQVERDEAATTDLVATDSSGLPASPGEPAAQSSGTGKRTTASIQPCAALSTAPGVSPTTLTVGQIVTQSGPVPGLAGSAEAAVRAYVAYRNSTGGVCGRNLVLLTADDGNDNSRFRTALIEMSPKALGLIGVTAGGDSGGADVMQKEAIPATGAAFSKQFQELPTAFDINPPPPAPAVPARKFAYLKEQGVSTAALVTLSAAQAIAELDEHQRVMEASGIKIVSRQILPVTTLSFDSAARVVANSEADYLFFLAADSHDAAMAQSMRDTGYQLKFEEYLTGYGSAYIDIAGSAAEGTTSWIRSLPKEDGSSANAELGAYLTWMDRTSPGAKPDVFAGDAWAAAKAFVDALENLPGPISRGALVAQLRALESYDGDGFVGTIDLGNERSKGCVIGMRVTNGQWKRLAPGQGFLC